jgi:hypothetical protein
MAQPSLFTEKEWAGNAPRTATALTEAEALSVAQRELGPLAYVYDRDAHAVSRERPASIARYYVGTGEELHGNGPTWEAALDAARIKAARP